MSKAEILKKLKHETGISLTVDRGFWEAPKLQPGIPKGALVELLGNARTEWLLGVLKQHPEQLVLWCEGEFHANPAAFRQRGVALQRIKFVTSKKNLQQPIRLALESGHYPFVITPNLFEELRIFQRFQLLAEKSNSTLFLMGEKKFSSAWPISLQLEINRSEEGLRVEVVRQKFGG